MAKDPAFLFYSDRFISGVQTMSFEDRGKYITLLALMHQQGRLDEETICFLVGSVSLKLKRKFKIDESGLWFNETLESEVEKRKKYCESRSDNGKQGGRPKKTEQPYKKPYENHMANHSVNVNKDVIIDNNTLTITNTLWVQVVKDFYNDFNWKEKFCRDKSVSLSVLEKEMSLFISEIELKEDTKDLKEVKRHFVNWYNVKLKKGLSGHPVRKLSDYEQSLVDAREKAKGKI